MDVEKDESPLWEEPGQSKYVERDELASKVSSMTRFSGSPSHARYAAVLEGATTDNEEDVAFRQDVKNNTPYLGYDTMTSADHVNDYVTMLNTIGYTTFQSFTPLALPTTWTVDPAARIVLDRQSGVIDHNDLLELYKRWHATCVQNAAKYYDLARLLIIPVHCKTSQHWVLVVASPRARHAAVICSMQNRRVMYDRSFILRDEYESNVAPAVAEALLVVSRMVHVSRQMRLLRIHLCRVKPNLATDRAACDAEMRRCLHMIDPMVLHNAPNFSYSVVPYAEPQRELDCAVYMMHMMRTLFFGTCSVSTSMITLYGQAVLHAVQNGLDLKNRGCALDESVEQSLMDFFVNETRPHQFNTCINLLVARVRREHIVRARTSLLRDLENWTNVFESLDTYHPDYVGVVDSIQRYFRELGSNAPAKMRYPATVAVSIATKKMLGKRKRDTIEQPDSTTRSGNKDEQDAKRACGVNVEVQ